MRRAAAAALAALMAAAMVAPALMAAPAPSGLHGPDLRGVTYAPSTGSTPSRPGR